MKFKKLSIFIMFLLFIGIFNVINANSWAGLDDAIALIGGCAAGGFMDKMWAQGSCGLYRAPITGDCDKCNLNPLQVCSEYQCRAIGQNCNWDGKQCVDIRKGDVNSPEIIGCKKWSWYNEYGAAVHIDEDYKCDFGKVIKGIGAVAEIRTNEFAKCKWDIDRNTEYKDMGERYFEIFDEYSLSHFLAINPGDDAAEDLIKQCEDEDCIIFVRCVDADGNDMPRSYAFVFGMEGAGVDEMGPRIQFFDIDSGFVMKFDENALDFEFIADDASKIKSCKYFKDEDIVNKNEYDSKGVVMNCYGERPAVCSTTLIGIENSKQNNFYFRCEDGKGNINDAGRELIIIGGDELIMSVNVNSEATMNDEIIATTSGGADMGNAVCSYEFNNQEELFTTTGEKSHKQKLDFILSPGKYNIGIKCEDYVGNVVEESREIEIKAVPLKVELDGTVEKNLQKVIIKIKTSEGQLDGEADCNLFFDDLEHELGDGISNNNYDFNNLILEDGKKHVFEVDKIENGDHKWRVVCGDIINNEASIVVEFTINTPNLEMGINPPTGTTLEGFNVKVTITTTRGVDGNGNSVCKIKAPEAGFVAGQFEGVDIENGRKSNIHVIDLPSATGLFGQTTNTYYIVCKDDAGKTNGQIITYSVNLAKSDLKFGDFKLDNKAELKTDKINPVFSFVTTGGKNLDGVADCDVECSLNENKVYENSYNTNIHAIQFNNLKDGSYNCKISCKDPYFAERAAQEVDKSFVVETPALNIRLDLRDLNENIIYVRTSGGIGEPECYYTINPANQVDMINVDWLDQPDRMWTNWAGSTQGSYMYELINVDKTKVYYFQCIDKAEKLSQIIRFSNA